MFQGGSIDFEELGKYPADNYKSKVWVCIANIRRKIDPKGEHEYIETVYGTGYRFRTPG